jgi:hypothetical protein
MLAYFYQGNHVGIWQDQSSDPTWVQRTAGSLGHSLAQVEVYRCPAVRSDTAYFFDEQKRLVTQKEIIEVEGQRVFLWNEPITLEKFYPITG